MATTDIATRELRKPITVSEYLFRRLYEVGVRSVHGVPGEPSPMAGVWVVLLTIADYSR